MPNDITNFSHHHVMISQVTNIETIKNYMNDWEKKSKN